MNRTCILIFISLATVVGAFAEPRQLLQELCQARNKNELELTRLSDVRAMIDLLKAEPNLECPEKVRAPLLDLEAIVKLDSVCSEEAADLIVDYWAKYVQKKLRRRNKLPKALKKFFISFGLQVSKVCRQTMIAELRHATERNGISQKDFDLVSRPVKQSSQVMALFGSKPAIENLLIVVRVDSPKTNAANFDEGKRRKVNMPPKEVRYFELMQERCLNKFKPVYDTLLVPLVRLSAIGLSNKADLEPFEAFKQDPIYLDWFAAVIACEPVLKHDAVSIPLQKLTGDNNVATITYLEEEDIAELKERTGLDIIEPSLREPIDYQVRVRLEDLVLDRNDKELTEAVSRYGKGLSQATKVKIAMAKKLPKLAKSLLNNKDVRFGLKPTKAIKKQEMSKFGADSFTSRRTKAMLGLLLVAGSLLVTIFAVPLAGPLFPLALTFGIMAILLSLFYFIHNLRELASMDDQYYYPYY